MFKVYMIVIPIALTACTFEEGYHLESFRIKHGYVVRVVNHSNVAIKCHLDVRGKHIDVSVKRKGESQLFHVEDVPRLVCSPL